VSRTLRELIAGIASGFSLVAMLVIGSMPWWLVVPLAIGLYAGLRLSLPMVASPDEIVHAGGVTENERQTLLRDCLDHVRSLQGMARQIEPRQPSFATSVQQFVQLTGTILARLEQEPDAVQYVGMLPLYLSKITANLDRYVDLLPRLGQDAQAQQRLNVTQEMVQRATASFEHLRQQLYRDDWIALEAEAEALKSLFEAGLL
jgi:hypothetical protein